MSFLLKGFKELNYGELIAVNGGCSGSCTGYTGSFTGLIKTSTQNPIPTTSLNFTTSGSGNCSTSTSSISGGDRVNTAILNNLSKEKNPYIAGKNDCDIWTENVLKQAGFDISGIWGQASTMTVAEHEKKLAGKTTDVASSGWSVVLMTDSDKYSTNHCGIVNVSKDGSVMFYQNTKSTGGPCIERYSSVKAFQAAYAYNDFDYLKITN